MSQKKGMWMIEPQRSDDPVIAFASEELNRYLCAMGVQEGPRFDLWIECPEAIGLREDGFRIESEAARVIIRGTGPRSVLYGVYAFLEIQGCRWIGPGDEVVPQRTVVELPERPIIEEPAFAMRGLIDATCFGDEFTLSQIDWSAKMRLNTYHPQWTIQSWGRREHSHWMPEFRKRGFLIQAGAHDLMSLLPRTERNVAERPEYFRLKNGQRTGDHNLCTASREALGVIQSNFRRIVEACPEIVIWHAWPDDLPGGGWCECDRCRALCPADQSLRVSNALAEVLEEMGSPAKVSFIAYHDTVCGPMTVRPHPKVVALLSLTERCEVHGIGGCLRCESYRRQAEQIREAGFADVLTFERYIDSFKFRWMQPVTPRAIFDDTRHFAGWARRPLAHQCFVIMAREWHAAYPNYMLFARAAWDPNADPNALLEDFCQHWYGRASEPMLKYHRAMVELFELALVGCQYVGSKGGSLLLEPLDTSDRFALEHASRIEQAQSRQSNCRLLLETAASEVGDDEVLADRIRSEMDILRITDIELEGLRQAVLGTHHRAVFLDGGGQEHREKARQALERVLSWEREYRRFIRTIGLNDEPNWYVDWLCKEIGKRLADVT